MDEGNRYRTARMARGLSQEDLSAACGVDARTIRKLEQGQGVSARTVRSVATALGIDLARNEASGGIAFAGVPASDPPPLEEASRCGAHSATPPEVQRAEEESGWVSKSLVVAQVGIVVFLLGAGIWFLVTYSRTMDAYIVALRSEISAQIAYPTGAAHPENVIDDLKARQTEIGYRIVEGRRGTIAGRDGSSDTLDVTLEPLDCPLKTPCDDVRKTAVFSDFSARMLSDGGVTTVTRQ